MICLLFFAGCWLLGAECFMCQIWNRRMVVLSSLLQITTVKRQVYEKQILLQNGFQPIVEGCVNVPKKRVMLCGKTGRNGWWESFWLEDVVQVLNSEISWLKALSYMNCRHIIELVGGFKRRECESMKNPMIETLAESF